MVRDLRGRGSVIRLTDLARYYAAERAPLAGTYRGYRIYSSAPPSAGGATLLSQLNLLEQFGSLGSYPDDAATLHAMIEAWKLVPSARGRVADPGLWPLSLEAFVSKDSARARWACFQPARALGAKDLEGDPPACAVGRSPATGQGGYEPSLEPIGPGLEGCEGESAGHCHQDGTTAFVVADAEGNVVAVTQTLGTWGGNFYVTPGLGFLYNDKLGSYPEDPGQYGARLPNARHGSSLAPTLVFKGTGADSRLVLGVGAAGNAWITSAVYAIVTGVVDQQLDVQRAIELPRFLVSRRPPVPEEAGRAGATGYVVEVEAGLAPEVVEALRKLGHEIHVISLPGELRMGYAAAVGAGGEGLVWAGADPRRSGAAGALGCGRGEGAGPSCTLADYPR
jgi:gamma-glutamyltranspeptidase